MSVNPSSFDNPVADSLKKSEFDEVNLATPTVYTSTSSPMAQAASNSTQPSPPRDDASTQSKQPSTVDPNILQQQAYPAQQQLAPQAGQPPVYTAVYAPGSGPFQPFGTHPEKAAYIIEADACAGGTYYVQGMPFYLWKRRLEF